MSTSLEGLYGGTAYTTLTFSFCFETNDECSYDFMIDNGHQYAFVVVRDIKIWIAIVFYEILFCLLHTFDDSFHITFVCPSVVASVDGIAYVGTFVREAFQRHQEEMSRSALRPEAWVSKMRRPRVS